MPKGEELYSLHHSGWISSITFSQHDRQLMVTARDRVARIWEIGKMELRVAAVKWKLEDPIHQGCWSPDESRVAFASGAQRFFGLVSVYPAEKGPVDGSGHQMSPAVGRVEHPDQVSSVAFSGNQRYLASGCLDGRPGCTRGGSCDVMAWI